MHKNRILALVVLMAMLFNFPVYATAKPTLNLGSASYSGGTFQFGNATVSDGGNPIQTILVNFTGNVTTGDSMVLPVTAGFTVESDSTAYSKRITATGKTEAEIQAYVRGITFSIGGTSQSVSIVVDTSPVTVNTFYNKDTQHYYQYIPFTTNGDRRNWTDAYNDAKSKTYMGRSGYLATVTSKDEDVFLNTLSGGKCGWLGGTLVTNTGNDGTLYYSGFNTAQSTSNINSGGWYWADGPERGQVFYRTKSLYPTATSGNATTQDATSSDLYFNWARGTVSYEPNNQTANGGACPASDYEPFLTSLTVSGNSGKQGTSFSWNDKANSSTQIESGSSDWDVRGYFVEYGNLTVGNDAVTLTTSDVATGNLIPDTTAPTLTAGAVNRTSDTTGTVKFTSDEAGSYYYAVVAAGDAAPTIVTTGAGISCTASENTITDPSGLTAGAKEIYIKVKDGSNNVSNPLIISIPAFTVPDTTPPALTAGAVNRTSDTTGTVKFTSDEAGSYYYGLVSEGASVPAIDTSGAGMACTTSEMTITNPSGLTAGAKDLYIQVKDGANNVSNPLKINIPAYSASSGGSSSTSSGGGSSRSDTGNTTTQATTGLVEVIVNGEVQNAGKVTNTIENGRTTSVVTVDNKVIEAKVDQILKNGTILDRNVVQVPVTDLKSQAIKVELTGDMVKQLEDKIFDVSIKRDNIEYIVPAKEFAIDKIAGILGVQSEKLEDIKVEVKIARVDDAIAAKYIEIAKKNGSEVVFSPMSFEIVAKTVQKDGTKQEVGIDKFTNYVERVMEIPANVDPSKITTGIVFNADGTYSHVPTVVFYQSGKWFAKLNSLTNSNYAVIWNPVNVPSVKVHWAKSVVNNMASRLIIFNPKEFKPNKAITRADFAEYMVRALGLYREGSTYTGSFKDVKPSDPRALGIMIANEYGIVTGFTDGTFKPNQPITREAAMVMYQKAMKMVKLSGSNQQRYINYKDYQQVSTWAKGSVKEVVAARVFNGTSSTTLSPQATLSYAEAAQAIQNLLVESKLINR